MAKPNYTPPIGGLATSRYDFEAHIEGLAFRHNADQIDVNPAVTINGAQYITVSDALNALSSFIVQALANGEGFVTIGDGYDCWHHANGTINFDPTVPSLDTILNPIFTAISMGNTLTGLYARIQRGGIIVIKAGTYYVLNTINVPPGITILGEGYGTKIVNATSLVIPPTAGNPPFPKLVSTAMPVFKILPDLNRSNNDGAINNTSPFFMFGRATKFMNFVLADNFVEPTILGDFNYKLAQNYAVNVPLILQEPGSHFECDEMTFVGRVNFSSPQVVGTNGVTSYPVQLDPANPVSTGTVLKVQNSFMDGFALAGEYRGTGYNADICEYNNNKIRVYGYLNNDSSTPRFNCALSTTACNIEFNDNYVVGDANNVTSGIYVDINGVSAPANKNLMPRASVTGNSGVVNKGPAGVNVNNNLSVSVFNTNESVTQTVIMASVTNNMFGSDSPNQRRIVATIAALQQLDDTSMAAGSTVWVSAVEEHFYLDRGTLATALTLSPNPNGVYATASGNGKWIRLLYLNYGNAQINGNLTVNGTITGSVSGGFTAGGDLSGSTTNQTVIGLQTNPVAAGVPTTGQYLKWGGTSWASAPIQSLQGNPVASSPPPVFLQPLTWTGSAWTPQNLVGPSVQATQATPLDFGNGTLLTAVSASINIPVGNGGFILVHANYNITNNSGTTGSTAVDYGLGVNTNASITTTTRETRTFAITGLFSTSQNVSYNWRITAPFGGTTIHVYALIISLVPYSPGQLFVDADMTLEFIAS